VVWKRSLRRQEWLRFADGCGEKDGEVACWCTQVSFREEKALEALRLATHTVSGAYSVQYCTVEYTLPEGSVECGYMCMVLFRVQLYSCRNFGLVRRASRGIL